MALKSLTAAALLALGLIMSGCGNKEADASTADSSIPPSPQAAGNAPTYTNDPAKDAVGADGMPGGGPTNK